MEELIVSDNYIIRFAYRIIGTVIGSCRGLHDLELPTKYLTDSKFRGEYIEMVDRGENWHGGPSRRNFEPFS